MTAENEQYEYDELRWLARDTHKKRRRALWWTAGLTLGAMTLATIYVQRDETTPAQSAPAAAGGSGGSGDSGGQAVNLDLGDVPTILSDIRNSLNNIDMRLADLPRSLNLRVRTDSTEAGPYLVWLVDGSRRFPMAEGDILWIPELAQWLRLTAIGSGAQSGIVEMWGPAANPPAPTARTYGRMEVDDEYEYRPRESGSADCLVLAWRGPSRRLDSNTHVDIEILFENSEAPRTSTSCNNPIPAAPRPTGP